MAALLFAIPILLIFFFIKKRGPTQKEFGGWILFLIPFAIMLMAWSEGDPIQKYWFFYLLFWLLAAGVLFKKPPKQKKKSDARLMWENSQINSPDGDRWYQKGWVIYIFYGILLIAFLLFAGKY